MKVDFSEFYDYVEKEFRSSNEFEASVHAMCAFLEQQAPHGDWTKINALNVHSDLQAAKEWLPNLIKGAPCPFVPRSIFFNILDIFGEEDDYGGYGPNHADLTLVLFADYDPDDESMEWIYGNERFDFDNSNANLPALKEAGLLLNGADGIGSEVYVALSVGYVLLLLRHVLNGDQYSFLKAQTPVGVVAGFGSGDLFHIGELTSGGLAVRSKPFIDSVET